jgi:poly(A) polymerase
LLFRYGAADNGSIVKKAHIYTQEEHGIDPHLVDPDAMWVLRGLRKEGFSAFVVGGAVRDMIVGRTPNDFDVATDAHPQQIKRVFRSARIIGRRFRIVHVYCGREKYIEVTTFRSRGAIGTSEHSAHPEQNNFFGTMEEDAERRDFTINALYYNPIDRLVIDYVGGVPDIRQKRLKTLGAAETSFAEDPVRMIRAVKYASLVGFAVPPAMAGFIRKMRESVLACSRERVTEEVYKILASGAAADIMDLANRLRLFEVIFPALAVDIGRKKFSEHAFAARLRALDERAREGKRLERNDMFGFLFRDLVLARKELLEGDEPWVAIQAWLRGASEPLFPSKKDLASAVEALLREGRPHDRFPPPGQPRSREQHRRPQEEPAGAPRKRRRRGRGRGRGRGPGAGPPPA